MDSIVGSFARTRSPELLRHLRRDWPTAYALSLLAVGLSFLAGVAIGRPIIAEIPFVPFYPAVLISALLGGFGPSAVTLGISGLAAWSYFFPRDWPIGTEIVALSTFALVNLMNIGLVLLLDALLIRVLAREQEVRTLLDTAQNGFLVVDESGVITLVNRNTEKLFGYSRSELVGKTVEMIVPERLAHVHIGLCANYMEAPEPRTMAAGLDIRGKRKDGSEFPAEIVLNGFNQDTGKFALVTVVDISDRKKAAEAQQLVVRELNHRIQNLFAVVQSIIRRSLQHESAAKQDLLDRVQALSKVYSMIANSAWEGAALDQLLQSELQAFTDRAVVSGCDLIVSPAAAQSFALIVHELATNAVKHGALSQPNGRVTLTGRTDRKNEEELFTLCWAERDGPEVKRPTRHGFGSTVLIDAAKAFGAQPTIEFAPEGIQYKLVVRLSAIQAASTSRAA